MAFLFQDQNQGIRNDAPHGMRLSRPFSFIRTLTVGFGIAPNLLTLPQGEEGARGLGLRHPYRRWGLSPRPENIGRPVERPAGNYAQAQLCQQVRFCWKMYMSAMTERRISSASWPGLTRPSIILRKSRAKRDGCAGQARA